MNKKKKRGKRKEILVSSAGSRKPVKLYPLTNKYFFVISHGRNLLQENKFGENIWHVSYINNFYNYKSL